MSTVQEISDAVASGVGQLVKLIETQQATITELGGHECPVPVDNTEQIAALDAQIAELSDANAKLKTALAAFT